MNFNFLLLPYGGSTDVQRYVSSYRVFFHGQYSGFFHGDFLASNTVAAFLSVGTSVQSTLQTPVFPLAIIHLEICWKWTWSSKHAYTFNHMVPLRNFRNMVPVWNLTGIWNICGMFIFQRKKKIKQEKHNKVYFWLYCHCTNLNATAKDFSHFAFKSPSGKLTVCMLCLLISNKNNFDRVYAYSVLHPNHFSCN